MSEKEMSTDFKNWNVQIMDEFHKNHGKLGGHFEGAPVLLVHSKGARTGKPHVNPLMYLKDGNRILIFASKGGADTHPDWYYNLKANPDAQVEIGDETLKVNAKVIEGPERDKLYAKQVSLYPQFGEYEKKTKRVIPVVALTPK